VDEDICNGSQVRTLEYVGYVFVETGAVSASLRVCHGKFQGQVTWQAVQDLAAGPSRRWHAVEEVL
jgi:hypothetical protein